MGPYLTPNLKLSPFVLVSPCSPLSIVDQDSQNNDKNHKHKKPPHHHILHPSIVMHLQPLLPLPRKPPLMLQLTLQPMPPMPPLLPLPAKATTAVAITLLQLPLPRLLSPPLSHFVGCCLPLPFLLLSATMIATVNAAATAAPVSTLTPSFDNPGSVALLSLSSLAWWSSIFD
jgi:hypothetical protein